MSLKSGATMLAHLPEERYAVRDIYIDRAGVWHERGRASTPDRILRQMDVALIALHGEYGESGEVQRLLDQFGVPYTGADAYGSHLSRHKVLSKIRAKEEGLLTPEFEFIERAEDAALGAHAATRRFHQPVVVKPVGWGSSVGVKIVGGYAPVLSAAEELFADGADGVLIEELIRGKEATVGVVEDLRGEDLYALPPIEVVPPEGDFYSYDAKYSGATRHVCPGAFSRVAAEELRRAAKVIHRALHQRHYSRSDFIVSPRGVYFLETNSAAGTGLTTESNLPMALSAIGVGLKDFMEHLVNMALRRNKRSVVSSPALGR